MGVYVPNIKKPKHCTECYFVSRDQCELQNNSYDYDTFKEQRKHCPLIETDLVRCGECKQLDQTKWCDLFLHYMNEDDFCSYGERRTDGDI